jgi:UDP-glucose 4-epimerase
MKILVTGGAGFIGRAVCRALRANRHDVVILDNFSSSKNEDLNDATLIEGDIRNAGDVQNAMRGCNAVVHLAALVSVPLSIEKPQLTQEINVDGFGNVLTEAEKLKLAGPVIFASSAAVYGGIHKVPVNEADATGDNLLSPYAESKWQNEQQAARSPLDTVGLRFFNVYGPGQDPKNPYSGVLSILADAASQHKTFTVFGNGEQTRDYVHVDDVATAIVMLLENPPNGHNIFNVGSGMAVTLNQLIGLVEIVLPEVTRADAPARPGDIKRSCSDVSALKTMLPEWKARDLAEGLTGWLKR